MWGQGGAAGEVLGEDVPLGVGIAEDNVCFF